jgi:hypothetical protein
MGVTLLEVGEHLSLEIESDSLDAVRAYLREAYSDLTSTRAGISAIVEFGGESFTFQNEWDDPCLISGSRGGDALLRAVHAHFSRVEPSERTAG